MPRPRKRRFVNFKPDIDFFGPKNYEAFIELTIDELECMRLSDIEKLTQTDAAEDMGIHQSTFQRTLSRAREKVTRALVNGKAIKISGGDFVLNNIGRGKGFGRGGFGQQSGNPPNQCVCPNCGYHTEHIRGQPCSKRKCPKCGTLMVRGD